MSSLWLELADGSRSFEFKPQQLVVAGFTGRDEHKVSEHIDELRRMGIAGPERIPMFWRLPADLITQDGTIAVRGRRTSGEVEPVLLCQDGAWYVGLGSDHTDRELEQRSLEIGKASCAKPISTRVLPYEALADRWDGIELRGWTESETMYQEGHLEDLLPVTRIVERFRVDGGELTPGTVVFLGTVPMKLGIFDYSPVFRGELVDGDKVLLSFQYKILVEGG